MFVSSLSVSVLLIILDSCVRDYIHGTDESSCWFSLWWVGYYTRREGYRIIPFLQMAQNADKIRRRCCWKRLTSGKVGSEIVFHVKGIYERVGTPIWGREGKGREEIRRGWSAKLSCEVGLEIALENPRGCSKPEWFLRDIPKEQHLTTQNQKSNTETLCL